MSSTANLRSRRSAAQLQALAGVEREIRAQDSHSRRKYLREFSDAFREYDLPIDARELEKAVSEADLVLIGDYHALAAAQRQAASLLEQRALNGDRPVVLAVEAIFARDQHVVDEWWRRQIDENELRRRIRFDIDWGYEWAPFYNLLITAREHGEAIYGLDCMPRGDLRRACLHDRHAAARLNEIGKRHPDSAIMVLFGESHLAPSHLPSILKQRLPEKKILTVLQNVDSLYWRVAEETRPGVRAVRVAQDVVCVFNATPLEKYESYRLCLDRWSEPDSDAPDFTPATYNLIDSLVQFLHIKFYSPHNGTQPKFLVDQLPEVYCHPTAEVIRKLYSSLPETHLAEELLSRLDQSGSVYLPQYNILFISEFRLSFVSQEIARFLHHACRGLPLYRQSRDEKPLDEETVFYSSLLEDALLHLATCVLCPLASGEAGLEAQSAGLKMGRALYDGYVHGRISRTFLRRLFLARLEEPGVARTTCLAAARKAGLRLSSLSR